MRDFLRFMRYLFGIIYFLRGILLSFGLLMLVCVFVIRHSENMPWGESIYFVLVTALTIGYGDITPETPLGRIVSITAGVIGLLMTGIVIASAVRALTMAMQEKVGSQEGEK